MSLLRNVFKIPFYLISALFFLTLGAIMSPKILNVVNKARTNHCPMITALDYDGLESNRYIGKSDRSLVWKSDVMAAITPIPEKKEFLGAVAYSNKEAQVSCTYRVGNNELSLKTDQHFSLGNDWKTIPTQGGTIYLCDKSKSCTFYKD